MAIGLNDVTKFFQKLEGYTINKDGILNQSEMEDAYKIMEKDSGDQIPKEIKDKFKNGLNSDAFNSMDSLGTKDGYVNDQEFYATLNKDADPYKPKEGPKGSEYGKDSASDRAGYSAYKDDDKTNLNSKETAKNQINDNEGILGSANDGGKADGKLTKEELNSAITLTADNKDTIDNADAKLEVMKDMYANFDTKFDNKDGKEKGGAITEESLAREIQTSRSEAGQTAS